MGQSVDRVSATVFRDARSLTGLIFSVYSSLTLSCYVQELVNLRLPPIGCIPANLVVFPLLNIVSFLLTYAANIQFTSHAAIGVNRFFALNDVTRRLIFLFFPARERE